ncbi:MAG: S9 family peptidase [Rhizomicrobium sp.]|nr:S9 family peptidase [Rhizomicrobium sp.]
MAALRKRAVLAAVLGVVFSTPLAVAQTPAPADHPPVEAFGTLPGMAHPSISPDGKHVATIQVYNGRPIARIFTLDPVGTPVVNLPFTEGYIKDVQWANNERLLITVNINQDVFHQGVDPWYRLVSCDLQGKNFAMMFYDRRRSRDLNMNAAVVSDLAVEDPDHIYMPLYNDFSSQQTLTLSMSDLLNAMFKVDVTTGVSELVTRGSIDTRDWLMDGRGTVVARIDQTTNPRLDHLKLRTTGGSWNEVAVADASGGYGLGLMGLTEDGKALVQSIFQGENGTAGLTLRSLADNSEKSLVADPRYDVDEVLKDPWTGRVIGYQVTADEAKDVYFNPTFKALQNGLQAAFPGAVPHAVTWDVSQQKIIVSIDSPTQPPIYFLLDRQSHNAAPIRKVYSGLDGAALGEMKPYAYKARDGLEIPAYLTLPPGKIAKKLPLVVFPHGGPMARDQLSFNPETQFLANRGYAVFQPNFRGSNGYGRKFMEAGYGQWGLKMQDDITDGVQKLIADGIVDPKRICIVGESYGGYAALAGAAFTPDLYACAAGWAGVYDLRSFLATRAKDYGRDSQMVDSWSRFIGDRWNESGKLDGASPAQNADKIKIPVLLMHGEDDTTVRIDQSQAMEKALRRAGKNVLFIAIPKETHYMETSPTRIRWLSELEKFLKANIGD